MILKITFKDNDFTRLIEHALDNGKSNSYAVLSYLLDFDTTMKEEDKLDEFFNVYDEYSSNYNNDDKPRKDYIDLFTRLFTEYIKKEATNSYKYLLKNLKIKQVKQVNDIWKNHEDVY